MSNQNEIDRQTENVKKAKAKVAAAQNESAKAQAQTELDAAQEALATAKTH